MGHLPVFTACNVHYDSCGTPPDVRKMKGKYYGYFENQHGEQWVLQFDAKADKGVLRGGDLGWDEVVEFDLHNDDWLLRLPIMNQHEQEWLQACLHAARGRPVQVDFVRLVELFKAKLAERGDQ
jgi:hypothetical protein